MSCVLGLENSFIVVPFQFIHKGKKAGGTHPFVFFFWFAKQFLGLEEFLPHLQCLLGTLRAQKRELFTGD